MLLAAYCLASSIASGDSNHPHVAIYGATPAGCAAAVAAARQNASVALIEPSMRVGGLTAGGLGHTDLGMGGRELGGITREFYARVSGFYRSEDKKNRSGTYCYQVEPHVAVAVYEKMLSEANVSLLLGHQLISAHKKSIDPTALESLSLRDFRESRNITASVFVDASYLSLIHI